MLSECSKLQWDTDLAARRAHATPFGDRDDLRRFVTRVHLRGGQATVAETVDLLYKASPDTAYADNDGVFEV